MQIVPQSVTSRATRIARWLEQNVPAPVCAELALLYQQADSWDLVARWGIEQVTDETWLKIGSACDETVRGIANEMRTRIAARLVWFTNEGKEWVTMPLVVPPDNPEDERPNLDGSALSLVKQAQSHSQASTQMLVTTVGEIFGHMREVMTELRSANQQLMDQRERAMVALEEANERIAEADERADEAEDAAEAAVDEASEAVDAAEEAVEQAQGEKSNKLLRLVAQAAGVPGLGGMIGGNGGGSS